jgi:hypothetical protein
MASPSADLPVHTRGDQSKHVMIGLTPVIVFYSALILSCLLGSWRDTWPVFATAELLAAIAGISLGCMLIGPFSLFGAGSRSTFFLDRAEPLREKVDGLRDQADRTKKRISEGETDALKEPVFNSNILEPEYAIGQGLISGDEFESFRNTYLAQSELSLGLIFPLLLIVLGATLTPQTVATVSDRLWMLVLVLGASSFLFIIAMERRQKYRIELKLLLVSRWDKQAAADKAAKEAKAKANGKTSEDSIRQILKEELKGLHLEVKPLVVEIRKSPEEAPGNKGTKPGNPQEREW